MLLQKKVGFVGEGSVCASVVSSSARRGFLRSPHRDDLRPRFRVTFASAMPKLQKTQGLFLKWESTFPHSHFGTVSRLDSAEISLAVRFLFATIPAWPSHAV